MPVNREGATYVLGLSIQGTTKGKEKRKKESKEKQ